MKPASELLRALAIASLALGVSPTIASEWEYEAEVYALAADVKATTATGSDISADFDDIIDDLEFAVFGSIAAKRDRLTLFANLLYVDTESRERQTIGPVKAELEVGLTNLVSTFGVGWEIVDTGNTKLSLVGAARYLYMDTDIRLQLEPVARIDDSESGSNWDGVVGFRGNTDLSERWYLTYYIDAGAGDSDLTWQATAALNYRFQAVDIALGYQHLEWEFDDQLLDDLEMSGPAVGLKFRF